jgi:hypothetical protein
MTSSFTRIPALAGLGLSVAAALLLAVSGCGGGGPQTGDAVVAPAPGENVPAPSAPAAPGGPSAAATSPSETTPAPTPAAPTKAEGWGTLKGKVTLKGTAPKPKVLAEKGKAAKDPEVCAKDAPIMSERLVVDGDTKGVRYVIVYIPKPTAVNEEAKSRAHQGEIVFDQEKCTFIPHVLVTMKGVTVDLKNSDPVNHNINSRLQNNGFNKLLSASKDEKLPVNEIERKPGELTCDIHPWMRAYWMVLDNPYFAVTDEKGDFEIKDVPAGTQKVVVWHEAITGSSFLTASSGDPVDIKAGDTTTKDFTIDAGKLRPE